MSTIITVVVIVAVVLLAIAIIGAWRARRRAALRDRFGSEYDRAVGDAPNRRTAERDLRERAERHDELDIAPLDPLAAERYRSEWRLIQERFVDAPADSVAQAHTLVKSVLADRGYPTDDRDERVSMLSVDHADVLDRYRVGMRTEQQWRDSGTTDTEELRQAMHHYRTVFDRLVSETAYPDEEADTTSQRGASRRTSQRTATTEDETTSSDDTATTATSSRTGTRQRSSRST
jgi:hypothetical protein